MKVLILSDIHGNRTALEAVLEAAEPFDAVWCLGDIIGYGPDPNDCVAMVRELPNLVCLRGNHDSAVIGLTEKGKFNPFAQVVLEWTEDQLNPIHRQYLQSLSPQAQVGDVTLAHGSPRDPVWEYIMVSTQLRLILIILKLPIVLWDTLTFRYCTTRNLEKSWPMSPSSIPEIPRGCLIKPL